MLLFLIFLPYLVKNWNRFSRAQRLLIVIYTVQNAAFLTRTHRIWVENLISVLLYVTLPQ